MTNESCIVFQYWKEILSYYVKDFSREISYQKIIFYGKLSLNKQQQQQQQQRLMDLKGGTSEVLKGHFSLSKKHKRIPFKYHNTLLEGFS